MEYPTNSFQTTSPKHPQANGKVEQNIGTTKSVLNKAYEDGTDPYIVFLECKNTPKSGVSYSLAQVVLNRGLKTKLPTTIKLLDARISTVCQVPAPCSTENTEPVFWQRSQVTTSCQNWWHCSKLQNLLTVTKLAHSPRSVMVTSNGTLDRRNRRNIIKTPEVNNGTIMSPKSDWGITKRPGRDIIKTLDIIRTRSVRAVWSPRLNVFVYY